MERNRLINLALCFLALLNVTFSCRVKNIYSETTKSIVQFNNCINSDSLFSHFPSKIVNSELLSGYYNIPVKGNCFGSILLCLKQSDEIINKIQSGKFIMSDSLNSDNFFTLEYDRLTDTSRYSHHLENENKLPITDFYETNYLIGELPDSTYLFDEKMYVPISKYAPPADLKIFIIDAKPGSIWKEQCNKPRSSSLSNWQNGYSRGYAISQKNKIIVYWIVVW